MRFTRWTRIRCSTLLGAAALVVAFGGSLRAETAPPLPAPSAAPSDASSGAGQSMREGAAHFAQGEWEEARQAFLRAWELKPHYAVAQNLAEVEIKLGLWRDAVRHLEFTLDHLPAGPSEERTLAESQFEACRQHLTLLEVVAIDGASLRLDGQEVGRLPLGKPVWLEPGQHRVLVEREGYRAESKELTAVSGDRARLEFELRPLPSLAPSPPPPLRVSEPVADSSRTARTWVLVGGGVLTLAAVGLGAGFWAKSDAAHRDALAAGSAVDRAAKAEGMQNTNSACSAPDRSWSTHCADLKRELGEASDARRVAQVSFIAAGVLGVATVTTFLAWRPKPRAGSLAPRVAIHPGLAAIGVAGDF